MASYVHHVPGLGPDRLRIGTWNLAGRWTERHRRFLQELDCDVLLLTEVDERIELPSYSMHLGHEPMFTGRPWAAVASRSDLTARPDPHAASALADTAGLTFCSSVLPWSGRTPRDVWPEDRVIEQTRTTLSALDSALPSTDLVWGGDWNHALDGSEHAGTVTGREIIREFVDSRNLVVPTEHLPSQTPEHGTIDHVAVPNDWAILEVRHVAAADEHGHLSDHDAYVVDARLRAKEKPERGCLRF